MARSCFEKGKGKQGKGENAREITKESGKEKWVKGWWWNKKRKEQGKGLQNFSECEEYYSVPILSLSCGDKQKDK